MADDVAVAVAVVGVVVRNDAVNDEGVVGAVGVGVVAGSVTAMAAMGDGIGSLTFLFTLQLLITGREPSQGLGVSG